MEKVIRANLKFVVKIALEYEESKMPLFDLIAEGNLGLFRALETFAPTHGIKFITYGKWWIRQCIVHALLYKGAPRTYTAKSIVKNETHGENDDGVYQKKFIACQSLVKSVP